MLHAMPALLAGAAMSGFRRGLAVVALLLLTMAAWSLAAALWTLARMGYGNG